MLLAGKNVVGGPSQICTGSVTLSFGERLVPHARNDTDAWYEQCEKGLKRYQVRRNLRCQEIFTVRLRPTTENKRDWNALLTQLQVTLAVAKLDILRQLAGMIVDCTQPRHRRRVKTCDLPSRRIATIRSHSFEVRSELKCDAIYAHRLRLYVLVV